MDNTYTYDAVSNVLSVANGASVPESGKAGGQMAHSNTYDGLYSLLASDDNGLVCAQFRLRSTMLKQCLTLHSLARKVVTNYWYNVKARQCPK